MGNRGYQLHKECLPEKAVYNQCDAKYWEDFRNGQALTNPCRDEWDDYQQCIVKKIHENIQKAKDAKAAKVAAKAQPLQHDKAPDEYFHDENTSLDSNSSVDDRERESGKFP